MLETWCKHCRVILDDNIVTTVYAINQNPHSSPLCVNIRTEQTGWWKQL